MPGIKVKICGLRRMQDIEYANILKPDYTGFILAEGYRRSITMEDARRFAERLDKGIIRTGVFLQLHGDEDNAYIERLRGHIGNGCNIIKAVRIRDERDILTALEYKCDYLLLDAGSGVQAGGNGVAFDWKLVKNINKPFFLAGGISADNAREAAEVTRPYALDASSSMETDGCKDFNKMKKFIDVVRSL